MRGHDVTTLLIEASEAITHYNQMCLEHDKTDYLISPIDTPTDDPETDTARRIATWFMPASYHELAMREHLLALCQRPDEIDRVNQEMDLFEARGLVPVLQLMCFLVDHFRQHNIVWGVGRGSSVASYCLFLLGLHKIDAIAYDLPIDEFLR